MYYKEIYQPRISDYDRNGKLSYEAILQILETAGSHHSDTVGDSVIEGSQCGIAWILTEWRVQILRRTDSKEKLVDRGSEKRFLAPVKGDDIDSIKNNKPLKSKK